MTTPDTIEVAAVQMSSQDDLARNLATVRELVLTAARKGARLVVVPENLAYMGPEEGKRAVAEPLREGERIFETLSMTASDAGVYLVAGGLPERSDDPKRPYNTAAVFAPTGALVAKYRKIHLFDVDLPDGTRVSESSANLAGNDVVVAEIDGFKLGLSICYDLRFPELYRKLADQGADMIVIPAAFTLTTGKDHWQVLVRARAIENQVYAIAAGQWGRHPKGRQTYGKSMIVDPWGEVIAQCSEGVGVCSATVSRPYLQQVRASLPALRHRRL